MMPSAWLSSPLHHLRNISPKLSQIYLVSVSIILTRIQFCGFEYILDVKKTWATHQRVIPDTEGHIYVHRHVFNRFFLALAIHNGACMKSISSWNKQIWWDVCPFVDVQLFTSFSPIHTHTHTHKQTLFFLFRKLCCWFCPKGINSSFWIHRTDSTSNNVWLPPVISHMELHHWMCVIEILFRTHGWLLMDTILYFLHFKL